MMPPSRSNLESAASVSRGRLIWRGFRNREKLGKVLIPGHQPGDGNHEDDAGDADQYLGDIAAGDLNQEPMRSERQQDTEAEDGKRMLSAQDQRAQHHRGELGRTALKKSQH